MARTSIFNKNTRSSNVTISQEDMKRLIEKKAYELYVKKGKQTGHSIDDWLEAERLIKAKVSR